MSKLTPCNRCNLQRIERDAAKRGAVVTVKRQRLGLPMAGWYEVRASDRERPIGWFRELTVECVC